MIIKKLFEHTIKTLHKFSPDRETVLDENNILDTYSIADFDCSHAYWESLKGCPRHITKNFSCEGNLRLRSLEHGPEIVDGFFNASYCDIESLDHLPIVNGNIDISSNQHLKSLKGSPAKTKGTFDCSTCGLKTLEFAPKEVGGDFCCLDNALESLDHCPEIVMYDFNCNYNNLVSLKNGPRKVGNSYLANSNKLTSESLQYLPETIGGGLYLASNGITSLQNIHKYLKKMDTVNISGLINVEENPLKSHVLGVLLIDGCKSIAMNNGDVEKIVNKYLSKPFTHHRVYECQDELIEAGFEDFAQL